MTGLTLPSGDTLRFTAAESAVMLYDDSTGDYFELLAEDFPAVVAALTEAMSPKPRRKKAKNLRPGDVLADGFKVAVVWVGWGVPDEVRAYDGRDHLRKWQSRDEWVDLAPEVQS